MFHGHLHAWHFLFVSSSSKVTAPCFLSLFHRVSSNVYCMATFLVCVHYEALRIRIASTYMCASVWFHGARCSKCGCGGGRPLALAPVPV